MANEEGIEFEESEEFLAELDARIRASEEEGARSYSLPQVRAAMLRWLKPKNS
jgi:hypothetical protein